MQAYHKTATTTYQSPIGYSGAVDANKKTDYVGNKICENNELVRILVDGGYFDVKEQKYYFYVQDHLGNNRLVVDQDGGVVQKTHYYPFGSAFADSERQDAQPYKYNGKELDQMHGLNLYDYSARYYEPAIGRFTTVDPLAEKYYSISPYAYVDNNPLKYIDPTGKEKINGLYNPKSISPLLRSILAEAVEKRRHIDNEFIHIYAHGSKDGFTFVNKNGEKQIIRNQTDFMIFLEKNSYTWRDKKGKDVVVVFHSCNIGEFAGEMAKKFSDVIFIAPSTQLLIDDRTGEEIVGFIDEGINYEEFLKGQWNVYENDNFYTRSISGEKNPDSDEGANESLGYENTWDRINHFLNQALAAGAKYIP